MTFHCEAASLDDLLHQTYRHILETGQDVTNTKGGSRETLGASLILHEPRNRISRSESRHRAVSPLAELCWYLSGSNHSSGITPYLQRYKDSVEADGTIHGGYGPRLFGQGPGDQIHNAISRLRNKPSSRRVVIQLLHKEDMLATYYKDIPCTNTIQYLVREDRLHTVVSMRSNDAWLGLVHDVFAFTMLQEIVARALGIEVGTYFHFVASLHLYTNTIESARAFVDEGLQATTEAMTPMPQGSPWDGVEQLLLSEQHARAGTTADAVQLPSDPYWGDLARILVAHHLQRSGHMQEASALQDEVRLEPFAELLQRRTIRRMPEC